MSGTFKFIRIRAAAALVCYAFCGCTFCGCGSVGTAAAADTPQTVQTEQTVQTLRDAETEGTLSGYKSGAKLLECNYYDEQSFIQHDRASQAYAAEGRLAAGVVTHHLTAGRMISAFMKTAAENRGDEIETVVITAPMHYPEDSELCTSFSDWRTPYGTAETDREIAELFVSELGAEENDRMAEYDHSVSALVPYVKYYLPEARVCCLLVSGQADKAAPGRISELYTELYAEKNCLFLFSIDFSHYLSPERAEEMDAITRKAAEEYDIMRISEMNDDNMDSPRCMCAFLELVHGLGGELCELDHGNSLGESGLSDTGAYPPGGITSYFVFGGVLLS